MVELFIAERTALDRIFECATHGSHSGLAARQLLCSWHNRALGGFELTRLWSFDAQNLGAAATVLQLICRAQGSTPAQLPGYAERWDRILSMRLAELEREGKGDG